MPLNPTKKSDVIWETRSRKSQQYTAGMRETPKVTVKGGRTKKGNAKVPNVSNSKHLPRSVQGGLR